jgi:hypothetical protein
VVFADRRRRCRHRAPAWLVSISSMIGSVRVWHPITRPGIGFVDEDHHLGRMEIGVESRLSGSTVHVDARLGLRDWSGGWDDEYRG